MMDLSKVPTDRLKAEIIRRRAFGSHLSDLREWLSLNQSEVGRILGISQAFVSQCECGKRHAAAERVVVGLVEVAIIEPNEAYKVPRE